MKSKFFSNIETTISASRLSTYKNHSNNTDNKLAVANYVLNAKISENFYFLLQNIEVSLRNAIYDNFKKHYPSSDFFYLHETDSRSRYLAKKEKHSRECWKMLCGAKHKLRHHNIHDGKIIAELNFGFWTELLLSKNAKYTNMWRKIFPEVFPNYKIANSIDKDKIFIGSIIDKTRKFRNRIFHYEPIFNQQDLGIIHKDIINILGWISADLQSLNIMFDEYSLIESEKQFILKQLRSDKLKFKINNRKFKKKLKNIGK